MLIDHTASQGETRAALGRACEHLLSLQDAAGWWKAELETNVTMDAEDLLLREFLDIRTARETEGAARWIRSQQRADGTWAKFAGGPGDLSTTIEAYVALRLAGDSPQDPHMRIASVWVREQGGLQRARVFTHIWMALFGLWRWEDVPAVPPEVALLPPWMPLNIYDFGCWARQTIVAISLVLAHRPCRPLPFAIDELGGDEPWEPPRKKSAWGRRLARLDRALHVYERRPIRWLRRIAMRRAELWVIRRQEADGSWGGIQPPWVYSIMALHLGGMPLDHPVLERALEGIEDFIIEDERGRRLEACQSPVWDTALAVIALSDGGVPGDHPAMLSAGDWLLNEQVLTGGDWQVRRPKLAPGGWSFEFANDYYPDVDDTAEVALGLLRLEHPDRERVSAAISRGAAWLEGMQSSGGGWGAFDADNTKRIGRQLPFCDFGEVIDDPSADVTAHAVEMLAALGRATEPSAQRGLTWLLAEQEEDGSWFGRWGVNHVYGTGAVVPALTAAGMSPSDPAIQRAIKWLVAHQNDDGGWGEDCRSYDDPAWRGRGVSTASQTAWALLALHAANDRSSATTRAVRFLVETQRDDGTWDEPFHTGTGFPSDFYINYHLYRLVFPIMALARCLEAQSA
ncbi:MAG TPA: squalene--hopene cyclase [Solirubrobacteraceae bacterium]|nr:squalene--hopene cyclase [Solirubrobacteraceae bacterium]